MPTSSAQWLTQLKPSSQGPETVLLCFPYSGGNPDLFRPWSHLLSDTIELVAVRLPGRGRRVKEPSYTRWKPLLNDITDALSSYLKRPHALYGHSFGGRLAYEVAHVAQGKHPGMTQHLFVSACRSPDISQKQPYLHDLPEDEFRTALHAMGGTPPDILSAEKLMKLMIPALRSDMRLAELWNDWHGHGVTVPLTAMYGRDDPIDGLSDMSTWHHYTSREFELIEIPGDHFFIETHAGTVVDIINRRLGESVVPG